MLVAELGRMEPHLADREVITEQQVTAARTEIESDLDFAALTGIIGHMKRPMVCLRIAV